MVESSLENGGNPILSPPHPKIRAAEKQPSWRAFLVKNFGTPQDRARHAAFAGLCATNVVTSSVFSLLASFFPQMAEERGLSPFTVGAIFGSFALIIFVSSPLLGLYMSRLGQRQMLLGGLVVCSLGTVAFGFVGQTTSYFAFVTSCFILRLIEGLGAAACETASTAITALLYPESLSIMVGLTETVCGLGFMIGPVVGGYLFHIGGSALPFFVMGGLGVPLLIYVARLVPEDLRSSHDEDKAHDSAEREREKGLLWELLRRKKVLVVLLTAALSNGSYAFLDPVLEPHMVRDLPSEAARIADDPYTATGLLFFWSSLIYTLAAPVTGYISAKDRLGSDNAMFWGMTTLSAGFMLLGPCPLLVSVLGSSMSSLFIALVMIGIGQSMALVPNMDALLAQCDDLGPAATNAVAGLLNSAYYLGAMLAPMAGSFLTGSLGFAWGTTVWAMGMGSYALYLISPDTAACFGWNRLLGKGAGKRAGAVVVGAPAAGSGSLAQMIGRAAQGAGSGVFSGAYRRLESHLQGSDAASGKV